MKKIKKTNTRNIFAIMRNYQTIIISVIIIAIYSVAMLSVIQWGIPGTGIAYPYHMDEWHQFMGVTSLVKHFTNNVPGASRGPMFFFLQTGFYLAPLVLLHIIHPSLLAHHFTQAGLIELHTIFIFLRLYILILGIVTLMLIYLICKRLRTNPILGVLFFATTPLWITWSNYFKYDAAVAFWIVLSIYFIFRYKSNPTNIRFYVSGIIVGLTIATKISATPLIALFVIAFFLFTPKPLKNIARLFIGFLIVCLVFALFGIPDILFLGKNWGDYIAVDIVNRRNSIFGMPWYFVLLTEHYPIIFGHGLYFMLLVSFVYYLTRIKTIFNKGVLKKYNDIIFFALGLLFFSASLLTLEAGAVSERLFVVLPFVVILVTISTTKLLQKYRLVIIALLCLVFAIQLFECFTWISIKLSIDPKINSSLWISRHIKTESTIGLENIPIYQGEPNNLILDYYRQQSLNRKGVYKYEILDNTKATPSYVIVTNADPTELFDPTSPKRKLIAQLNRNGYKQIATFKPDLSLYSYFGSERDFYFAGLLPANTIGIYAKSH